MSFLYAAAPTVGDIFFPIAAAADVGLMNATVGLGTVESCQSSLLFVRPLVQGKLIICRYAFGLDSQGASIATVADTIHSIGAAGFIMTINPDKSSQQIKDGTVTLRVPGVILNNLEDSLVPQLNTTIS